MFATIVISVLLAVASVLIVFNIRRKKKQGQSACGCGCSNCAMSQVCHKDPG